MKPQTPATAKRSGNNANKEQVGSTLHMPRLLSVPEAATILGVSVWTLRQWLSQRRIAIVKVGRLTKLQLEDLQAFIAGHRREAHPF
jgi:excisionase family DNA binding protein